MSGRDPGGEPPDASTVTGPSHMNIVRQYLQQIFPSLKGHSIRDKMKTKNFYLLILFLLALATTLWLLVDPSPNFHMIVSETHKQISNIKNIPSNIRQSNKEYFEVDKKYLDILGFSEKMEESVQDDPKWLAQAVPVVVTPVDPESYDHAKQLQASINKYLPGKMVVFYDLGLNGKDSSLLHKTCNSTKNNCEVKLFNFNKYPSHLKYLEIRSYLPICIQEALMEYGAIIWTLPQEYLISKDISNSIDKARDKGIVAWTIQDPTSSLTHPKMFDYFKVSQEDYYFHRAVKTDHLVIFGSEQIHSKVMLPWVKCALVEDCISPTGAQNTGCSYPRKPRYLYSGCHRYEMSALNVILGKVFEYETPYGVSETVFGTEEKNKNSTASSGGSVLVLR